MNPSASRHRKSAGECPAPLALAVAACAFRVPPREVGAMTRRSARSARVRQTAMYLAHVCFGQDFSAIGRGFGRDPSTVRHACALIEDVRGDARFDRLLSYLERACLEFAAAFPPSADSRLEPSER